MLSPNPPTLTPSHPHTPTPSDAMVPPNPQATVTLTKTASPRRRFDAGVFDVSYPVPTREDAGDTPALLTAFVFEITTTSAVKYITQVCLFMHAVYMHVLRIWHYIVVFGHVYIIIHGYVL